jgi:hypothetical protein
LTNERRRKTKEKMVKRNRRGNIVGLRGAQETLRLYDLAIYGMCSPVRKKTHSSENSLSLHLLVYKHNVFLIYDTTSIMLPVVSEGCER